MFLLFLWSILEIQSSLVKFHSGNFYNNIFVQENISNIFVRLKWTPTVKSEKELNTFLYWVHKEHLLAKCSVPHWQNSLHSGVAENNKSLSA